MTDSLLLPEGARLLHIGPHKTGSTAIQVAMFRARPELAAHGVYYPGRRRRRREASEQLFPSGQPHTPQGPLPHWDALSGEVAAAGSMRVCVSDELFGKASDETAAKIVHDLGGADVHVIAVARRLDTYLPSQWQERVKSGLCESYDAWLRVVLGDDVRPYEHRNVWRSHDLQALVERWVQHVGPDRVTLVIADESDRTQLPRLLEAMLGLPQGLLELDHNKSNPSVALAEVELIRAVNNALFGLGWSRRDCMRWVRHVVRAAAAYRGDLTGGLRPPMPKWAYPRVQELSDLRVEAIAALPISVMGDPEWLRAAPLGEEDFDASALQIPIELAATVVARVVEAAHAAEAAGPKLPTKTNVVSSKPRRSAARRKLC